MTMRMDKKNIIKLRTNLYAVGSSKQDPNEQNAAGFEHKEHFILKMLMIK